MEALEHGVEIRPLNSPSDYSQVRILFTPRAQFARFGRELKRIIFKV
jgi:hypothetical protein